MAKLKLIESGELKGLPLDVWRFLTGSRNRLDYGATYVRTDGSSIEYKELHNMHGATYVCMDSSSIEYRELHNMHDCCGNDATLTYSVTSGCIHIDDVVDDECAADALAFYGWTPTEYPIDTREGILRRLDVVIAYGYCAGSSDSGNNARKLLGFDPWCAHL